MSETSTATTGGRQFPRGFVWGAASAAYQIEGAVAEDGRAPSIWDTFAHTPGKVAGGDTGDLACDHYHRVEQDLDLMVELGLRSYRFSTSWARVMPDGRSVNQAGVDFYRRLAEGLRQRNITPLMTLYHWDLPQVLDEPVGQRGWLDRDTAERFADYALVMGKELGDLVPGITTLNEPWCSAFLGYATGEHAPGCTTNALAYRAAHHLNLAHGLAVSAIRSVLPEPVELSVTLNVHHVQPATTEAADIAAARHVDAISNRIFLEPMLRGSYPEDLLEGTAHLTDWSFVQEGDLALIQAPIDRLGVNYYSPALIAATPDPATGGETWPGTDRARGVPSEGPRTVMGWPIVPSGLRDLLVSLDREYGIPLMVTENGCSGHDTMTEGRVVDQGRIDYLRDHLGAVADAIEAGADVRGYYLWTLLDNFEWAWGYDKRFGCVYVDFETQVRTIKESGWWYRDVVAANGLA